MKTFLIAVALIVSIGAYAQDKTGCPCKSKAAHKVATIHHKVRVVKTDLPPYITVLEHVPNTTVSCQPAPEPCFTYTKDNIVVQECPATISPSEDMQYSREGVYLGYYPKPEIGAPGNGQNEEIAPQHTVINNYRGIAPADGNSCTGCSAW